MKNKTWYYFLSLDCWIEIELLYDRETNECNIDLLFRAIYILDNESANLSLSIKLI